jgi:cupin 2 domain-containing protein
MTSNFFANLPNDLPEELVNVIIKSDQVRVERIVSQGQSSPKDFWYDQNQNEWVILLKGAARLTVGDKTIDLASGDFINLPAHTKHRIEWTKPDEPTVWLAVFY